MDRKIEKVLDSILKVLVAVVGEILKSKKTEDNEKRD